MGDAYVKRSKLIKLAKFNYSLNFKDMKKQYNVVKN